jgi:hypothetical protein
MTDLIEYVRAQHPDAPWEDGIPINKKNTEAGATTKTKTANATSSRRTIRICRGMAADMFDACRAVKMMGFTTVEVMQSQTYNKKLFVSQQVCGFSTLAGGIAPTKVLI